MPPPRCILHPAWMFMHHPGILHPGPRVAVGSILIDGSRTPSCMNRCLYVSCCRTAGLIRIRRCRQHCSRFQHPRAARPRQGHWQGAVLFTSFHRCRLSNCGLAPGAGCLLRTTQLHKPRTPALLVRFFNAARPCVVQGTPLQPPTPPAPGFVPAPPVPVAPPGAFSPNLIGAYGGPPPVPAAG